MLVSMKTKINTDRRGKITTGIKAINSAGKEYPKAVDYFVINDFPELIKSYGDKPNKLVLYFPSNVITDFFDTDRVLYGSNHSKIRQCDEDKCLHRIKETIGDKTYEAGEISGCVCASGNVPENKQCRVVMYLRAWVADLKTGYPAIPQCYLFYSGSKNTADNIWSELKNMQTLFGSLVGMAFGLQVDMVEGKQAGKKFPIWSLKPLGTTAQIQTAINNFIHKSAESLFNFKEMLKLEEPEAKPEAESYSEDIDKLFSDEQQSSDGLF